MAGRLTLWCFPELGRVERGRDRRRLWSAAYSPVLNSRVYWLIALGTQVGAQVLLGIPISRYARHVGLYGGFVAYGLPVAYGVLAGFVTLWLVRRRITHYLRRELATRGLPTCLKCGYNLTGNVSGRCPECGTPIGDTR